MTAFFREKRLNAKRKGEVGNRQFGIPAVSSEYGTRNTSENYLTSASRTQIRKYKEADRGLTHFSFLQRAKEARDRPNPALPAY